MTYIINENKINLGSEGRGGKKLRLAGGFTFVELLVVVLILAILMAVALPIYFSAVTDSQAKACRANMQTIANNEREYKLKGSLDANGIATYSYTTSLSALSSVLPTVPVCPTGGTYTLAISNGALTAQNGQTVPNGWVVVSCSAAGHGKFALDIDTN